MRLRWQPNVRGTGEAATARGCHVFYARRRGQWRWFLTHVGRDEILLEDGTARTRTKAKREAATALRACARGA